MGNDILVNRGKELVDELSDILRNITDQETLQMLGSGRLDNLLKSILNPKESEKYPNLQEFFLAINGEELLYPFSDMQSKIIMLLRELPKMGRVVLFHLVIFNGLRMAL